MSEAAWRTRAACTGMTDDFCIFPERFPTVEEQARIDKAKAICATCPALDDCRTWALDGPVIKGVVIGGMSPGEYRSAHRKRRARQT